MLARLLSRPLHLRFLPKTLLFTNQPSLSSYPVFYSSLSLLLLPPPPPPRPRPPHPRAPIAWPLLQHRRSFSSSRGESGDNGDNNWKFTPEAEEPDTIFGKEEGNLTGIGEGAEDAHGSGEIAAEDAGSFTKGGSPWADGSAGDVERDIFEDIDRVGAAKERGGDVEWETVEGYKPWSLGEDEEKGDVFGIGEEVGPIEGIEVEGIDVLEKERHEEQEKLKQREQELQATLKDHRACPVISQQSYHND